MKTRYGRPLSKSDLVRETIRTYSGSQHDGVTLKQVSNPEIGRRALGFYGLFGVFPQITVSGKCVNILGETLYASRSQITLFGEEYAAVLVGRAGDTRETMSIQMVKPAYTEWDSETDVETEPVAVWAEVEMSAVVEE